MKLYGTPLEIGREVGCLGDNIVAAMMTGRVEELGKPVRLHTIDPIPGQTALWFACQGEHCQDPHSNGELGTLCEVAIRNTRRAPEQFDLPEYAVEIVAGFRTGNKHYEPLCANRTVRSLEQEQRFD